MAEHRPKDMQISHGSEGYFTLEFWTALHAALGTTLVFGSPHHHNTNAKTAGTRQQSGIADVLRSSERQDDWSAIIPHLAQWSLPSMIQHRRWARSILVTPFYGDRGQHSRRPLWTVCIPSVQRLCCRPTHGPR